MKRWIAILLAALLVLPGCAALAEDFPAFTITGKTTVDPDGLRAALDALGLEPSQADVLAEQLGRMDGGSDSLVFADKGFQYDLTLADGTTLFLAGEEGESGLAMVSSLFPAFIVTGSGLHWDEAANTSRNVTDLITRLMDDVEAAFVPGTAELGSFQVNGEDYDLRVPLSVDAEALLDVGEAFFLELSGVMPQGWPVSELDSDRLPAIAAARYSADGKSDTLYAAELIPAGGEAPGWQVALRLDGGAAWADIEAPDATATFAIRYTPDGGGATLSLQAAWNEHTLNLETRVSGNVMTTTLFAPDGETPAITQGSAYAEGGVRTAVVSGEGKIELNAEALAGAFAPNQLPDGLPSLGGSDSGAAE